MITYMSPSMGVCVCDGWQIPFPVQQGFNIAILLAFGNSLSDKLSHP